MKKDMLMYNEHQHNGISLISLIITIIVIIILAAIVIFTGLNTPDRANFAKFTQTISDFRIAIQQDCMNRKAKYATEGKTRSTAQIYYIIAKGTDDLDVNDTLPSGDGAVADLGLTNIEGTRYYEITSDANVTNWKRQTKYYETSEKHYVTDVGDVFVLKGYPVEQGGAEKWYVNERVVSNTAITGPVSISVSNIRILASNTGDTEAETNLTSNGTTTVYINFDASMSDGSAVTVDKTLPYPVTANGNYTFTITGGGKTKTIEVTVNNFKEPTLADTGYKIGDIVDYQATTTSSDGYDSATVVAPGVTANAGTVPQTGITWKILSISDSEIKITPGVVNASKITMSGADAYMNCATGLNAICNKLYKNTTLNLPVTNMTVEELNYASNEYTPTYSTSASDNVVFYEKGTALSSTTGRTVTGVTGYTITAEDDSTITVNENGTPVTYTKKAHYNTTYNFYTGNGIIMYGGMDGTKVGGYDTKKPYKETTEGTTTYHPLFVRKTYYSYTPSSYVDKLRDVLGTSSYGWLASPCVYVGSSSTSADFYVRNAYGAYVYVNDVASSNGYSNGTSYGLLPVVSLSSAHLTGKGSVSGGTTTAGTASDPWGVK